MKPVYGIGIESSCDETGIALVKDGKTVLANPVFSQIEFHAKYGGVVPESASRMHLEKITPMLEKLLNEFLSGNSPSGDNPALEDISYIACTVRPGLVGSLLVGYYTAKAMADLLEIPFIPIHHLEAHLYAPRLNGQNVTPPFLGLLLSGGNSSLYKVEETGVTVIGDTFDDAAGEALDKAAGLLNLPYPGGPEIEKLAAEYAANYTVNQNAKKPVKSEHTISRENNKVKNKARNPLPKILSTQPPEEYNFSFSGIKTALYYLKQKGEIPYSDAQLAWAFQERVFEIVLRNVKNALTAHPFKTLVAAGGVMANSTLKKLLVRQCEKMNVECIIPPPALCTDNGAMVAALGYKYYRQKRQADGGTNDHITSSKLFETVT